MILYSYFIVYFLFLDNFCLIKKKLSFKKDKNFLNVNTDD